MEKKAASVRLYVGICTPRQTVGKQREQYIRYLGETTQSKSPKKEDALKE